MTPLPEIEAYFASNPPTKQVKIRPGETVFDPVLFVNSIVKELKANPGNKRLMPKYERLRDYYLFCRDGAEPKYEGLDYQKIRDTLNKSNNEQTKN